MRYVFTVGIGVLVYVAGHLKMHRYIERNVYQILDSPHTPHHIIALFITFLLFLAIIVYPAHRTVTFYQKSHQDYYSAVDRRISPAEQYKRRSSI